MHATNILLEYYHEKTMQQRFPLILTRENDATKNLLEY